MDRSKIRIYGDPILRKRSEEVNIYDAALISLVEEMVKIMFENDGLGLAAPQIGISKRVAVVLKENEPLVMVNPTILETSTELVDEKEGCLSFPNIYEVIKRPKWVRIKAFNTEGKDYIVEGDGLLARAILHEIDHLDGKLLIDYLSPARRAIIKSKMRKLWEK
ncbi:MAG: peptide deformylase [Synergistetes bacterium]|nr:peptide deformylase [Synergistota bacterium]MCX8128231.1 peptide deformylase [Synergistota bacterium]MDW8192678.1 peptide deformylase [Synergistota bacterium]